MMATKIHRGLFKLDRIEKGGQFNIDGLVQISVASHL